MWIFVLIVLGYAAVVAMVAANQRKLLYFPHPQPEVPGAWGLPEMRSVGAATADGLTLRGWFRPPGAAGLPTILYFQGNAGHAGLRADKARVLLDRGYGLLLAGYRGYAGNPGRPSEQGLLADGRAWADFLVGEGITGSRLVLWGESLGSGVAVPLAAERSAAALVLEAPYSSMTDVAAHHYRWLPVRALLLDRFDNLARIADVRAPILIVHGERDGTIPVALARRLARAASGVRAHWLEGAGHNDLVEHGLMGLVLQFLDDLDRPDGPAAPTLDQVTPRGRQIVPR